MLKEVISWQQLDILCRFAWNCPNGYILPFIPYQSFYSTPPSHTDDLHELYKYHGRRFVIDSHSSGGMIYSFIPPDE